MESRSKSIVGMKALSIIMPWPWLIMKFGKDVENRSWSTSYRGQLLIHASKKPAPGALDMMNNIFLSLEQIARLNENCREIEERKWQEICSDWCGHIVGTVEIVDCVRGYKSRWAEPGMWHWVLKNPVLFTDPIPARGSLRLWEYKG